MKFSCLAVILLRETNILLLDFQYFGLQNGDECHCGNSASRFLPTYPSQCNKRCIGDHSQFCGSHWRLNVFQNFETITRQIDETTIKENNEGITTDGIFVTTDAPTLTGNDETKTNNLEEKLWL